jgi:hypothetical protein
MIKTKMDFWINRAKEVRVCLLFGLTSNMGY